VATQQEEKAGRKKYFHPENQSLVIWQINESRLKQARYYTGGG
jgi:hypothetical protein